MREDKSFAALWRDVPKPQVCEAGKNAWILSTTWRLVDERVSMRRDIAKNQALIRRLGRAIKAILRGNMKYRAEEAGAEAETLLGSDLPLSPESFAPDQGVVPPAWVTLERITEERVELYIYIPSPGTKIPISVQPFPVEDLVPMEDNIEWDTTTQSPF